MRMFEASKLVPWEMIPLTDEQNFIECECITRQATRYDKKRVVTAEELQRTQLRRAKSRADVKWLRDNLPIGTVFQHLGVYCMVVGHNLLDNGLGKDWAAVFDMPTSGGVAKEQRFVPTMRAMLEGSFVVDTTAYQTKSAL